jgi:hypothetical protein
MSSPNWYFCSGALIGVADTPQSSMPSVQPSQMRVIVMRYLNDTPERWHQNGAKLVLEAFQKAWPCKTTA